MSDRSGRGGPRSLPIGVTCDAFLDGKLRLLQPRHGPRAAIDALFLAAAVPARAGEGHRVLEAGAGSGIVSLALAWRVEDADVTGVELQGGLRDLAHENAELNGLDGRVRFLRADVTAAPATLAALGLAPGSFDLTAANPPYLTEGRVRASESAARRRARVAGADDLDLWIRFLTAMTASKGTLTVIHRADALGTLLARLERRFGGLVVFPLFPRRGEPASRVLIQGIKGSRAPLRLARGLVLHEVGGAYTPAAEAVLREGRPLSLV